MTITTTTAPGPLRSLAALVALAAPVVAVVVSLAIWELDDFIVLLVSMLIIIVSTWYALTRRGLLRFIALVIGFIPVMLVLLLGVSMFFYQILLLIVFAVAGRYALGHDAETLFERGCLAHDVGPARHGVVLINPRSGNGKAATLNLEGEARDRGIQPIVLQPGDDLLQLAEQAAADGADVLGMAGGDGSQALVASVAMRHNLAYVCVPSGTRNHFALDLGLDRSNAVEALDAFADGVERTIDLGRVNDRVFVNNASLGVYAQVVQSSAYRDAKARTWGRLLPNLLGPSATPLDLEFDGPDARHYAGMPLVLVSNNPYRLTRVARSGGRPKLDTGQLGIVAARVKVERLRRFGDLMEWSQSDFEVRSTAHVPVGLDGEALLLAPPLRFASLPGALRVRLPRNAQGAKRARRNAALTRRDLAALVRVALGRSAVPASPTTA
jgi:diacylglycerol kinase family enzyme